MINGIVFYVLFAIAFLVLLLVVYILSLFPVKDFITCYSNGVDCSIRQLIAMRLRKVPTDFIVEAGVRAKNARLAGVNLERLEVHFLSGGNVQNVVNALISAKNSHIPLDFSRAAAIDLAGRDVDDAVRMSVHPRMIRIPPIHGIAKDGIELVAKANVTVRSNLNTMVGGAGHDTIIARVGEGIVSAIGLAESHQEILKKPEILSQRVISAGLDVGTAFEIVSLDISDIDVGRNIGAALKNAQAIADQKVAEAKAEGRRALATALTQENKAAEQEARANLIAAEMKIPLAVSERFRAGKIIVKRKPKNQRPVQAKV